MDATDHDLVRSATAGDERAFHALVDRHAPGLFRVALSLSRNRADAEDLMQETFVGAYRGLGNFAGRSSVKTWLVQILTRQAAKAWHRNRHGRSSLPLQASGHGNDGDGSAAGAWDRADAALATSSAAPAVEAKIDVMDVLRRMTDAHREVLVLREIRGLSYEEIATVLGVPRGTVESRLHRARAEFRERYGTSDARADARADAAPDATSGSDHGAGGLHGKTSVRQSGGRIAGDGEES